MGVLIAIGIAADGHDTFKEARLAMERGAELAALHLIDFQHPTE